VVISGTSLLKFWDNNLVPFSRVTLKMWLIGCSEISIMKYTTRVQTLLHSSSHQNVPKKRRTYSKASPLAINITGGDTFLLKFFQQYSMY
jgi:hypothetical protein